MQIARHTVVTIDYTLTDDDGNVIDTSKGHQPLTYIHGVGAIIPGLEQALEGKAAGDQLNVTIEPAHGYGERHEALTQVVPIDRFEGVDSLEVGMQFQAETENGVHVVTVTNIDGGNVTIDANHPLAGQNLTFDVAVREVRPASAEEISHGHVHGPGGHHH